MPVKGVTERSAASRTPKVGVPRLVGREQQMTALAEALGSPPRVVLVEGEAGIGKTRLVQEALTMLPALGGRVLVAACPPFRQPYTLGPLVDALRQGVGDVTGLRLSALGGALRPLFPEWAAGLPPALESLEDPAAARHRLLRAMAEMLERLAVTLLVVEDVHWADDSTLEFLLFAISRQPQRLSLLLTYRPEDIPAGSLLRRLSSRPAGVSRMWLTLEPLNITDTASLISSMLDDEPVSERFAAFLHERTDGLPLAIEESVRLLHERADVARRSGGEGWERRRLDEIDVPPTVRDAVLERAERLSEPAQRILRTAAVLTDPASEAVLLSVSALSPEDAHVGLAAALESRLLHEDGNAYVAFRHLLASRAIYEAIAVSERRAAHLRAAQALGKVTPPPITQVARHYREAGKTAEWCRYTEQAADLALATGDEATAAALLHDLTVNADLPVGTVARLIPRIPLYSLTSVALVDDLVNRLRWVLTSDDLDPDDQAELRWHLGRILLNAGDFQEGIEEVQRAIPGLTRRPLEAVRAMIALGTPTRTLWSADVHRSWLDRAARTMAESPVSPEAHLAPAVDRATALLELGDEAGWTAAAGLTPNPATPQEALATTRGWLNTGDGAMRWGRYDEARQRLDTALRLTRKHDYPRVHVGTLVTLAHLDYYTGNWAGLRERAAALADLDDIHPHTWMEAVLVVGLLSVAAGANRMAREKLRMARGEETSRGVVDIPLESTAALARLHLMENSVQEALDLTGESLRVITAKEIWLWATDIAPVRVQALIALGCNEEAAKLIVAFARGLRGQAAPAPRAALASCRAILAESQGENVRAAALFRRAASAWGKLPRPYEALLARERQAQCLLNAGEGGAGLALLTRLRDEMITLGARGDANRVVSTLREHGVAVRRPQRGGKRGYGDQLSPREVDVVRLVAIGHSNREIGEILTLSRKTVACHLDSAMRKLQVGSRTALAVRAVQVGIITDESADPTVS